MCFFLKKKPKTKQRRKKMVKQQQQQQLLCLDRLIQDLQQLNNDHQTADVIFIVDNQNHQHSNESNNNELTKLNDNNDGKNDDNNDNQNTETLYAHRLILRARYVFFGKNQMINVFYFVLLLFVVVTHCAISCRV